jgi:hypothetical protein
VHDLVAVTFGIHQQFIDELRVAGVVLHEQQDARWRRLRSGVRLGGERVGRHGAVNHESGVAQAGHAQEAQGFVSGCSDNDPGQPKPTVVSFWWLVITLTTSPPHDTV